ncbi:fumarylacetoacetate hydrolase family protein [Streptomyces mirabilis]|uniref:fumarylacetoacetate hydrolase family protein n=1 Tax=Streptomyces mirabilis TaxID=68239 RepID=UPI003677CEDD
MTLRVRARPVPGQRAARGTLRLRWLAHKGQDGFCPVGPYFAPHWSVKDPADLRIRTWVNGEIRQDSSTEQMLFPVERLLSFASTLATLHPGDLVLTGTPAGVGAGNGRFLGDGDQVRIEIQDVGDLTNTFRGTSAVPSAA